MKPFQTALVVLATLVVAISLSNNDQWVTGLVILVAGLGLAWLTKPPMGTATNHEGAQAAAANDGAPIIYWRASCSFCLQMRLSLGKMGRRAHWVNIKHDPDAAAFVRSVNGGNETVPTVVMHGQPVTNPDPQLVRKALPRLGHQQ